MYQTFHIPCDTISKKKTLPTKQFAPKMGPNTSRSCRAAVKIRNDFIVKYAKHCAELPLVFWRIAISHCRGPNGLCGAEPAVQVRTGRLRCADNRKAFYEIYMDDGV